MSYVLLTGATGLLGRYLLRDLLLADRAVAVLVRGTRRETAAARIETVMARWEDELGRALPRPVALEGEISQPGLGLSQAEQQWIARHCRSIIHSAARLTFHADSSDGEPWRSNVQGTRHVLELCRQAGIRDFHYVSTAYVCGLRQGLILEEEVNVGQQAGNDYEQSKLIAEEEVRAAEFLDCVTCYRPSIIVGDSETGYTSTFHGFYSPLRMACSLMGSATVNDLLQIDYLGSMGLQGNEGKNFVPVDWVSAVMAHVLLHPEHYGKTYHLASSGPVTVDQMRQVFEDAVVEQFRRGELKTGSFSLPFDMGQFQESFYEQMGVYRSYWRNDPAFDCRNTLAAAPHLPCPAMNHERLFTLATFALKANFGWPKEPQVVPRFRVDEHLSPLLEAGRQLSDDGQRRKVGLQVNGRGGGQWHLTLERDDLVAAAPGLTDDCCLTYYLNSHTFDELARGSLTPLQSLKTGQVVVMGNSLANEEMMQVLKRLVRTKDD